MTLKAISLIIAASFAGELSRRLWERDQHKLTILVALVFVTLAFLL